MAWKPSYPSCYFILSAQRWTDRLTVPAHTPLVHTLWPLLLLACQSESISSSFPQSPGSDCPLQIFPSVGIVFSFISPSILFESRILCLGFELLDHVQLFEILWILSFTISHQILKLTSLLKFILLVPPNWHSLEVRIYAWVTSGASILHPEIVRAEKMPGEFQMYFITFLGLVLTKTLGGKSCVMTIGVTHGQTEVRQLDPGQTPSDGIIHRTELHT